MKVKVKIDINAAQILASRGLGPSCAAQHYLASEMVRLSDPYVPFRQGALKNSATIAQDGSAITYPGPYAHYQYEGKARGPNIPIIKGGQLVSFFPGGLSATPGPACSTTAPPCGARSGISGC